MPESGLFDVERAAIRRPKRLWLHRIFGFGRIRRTIEEGMAVEWYVTRQNVVVILSSMPTEDAAPYMRPWR